MENIADKISTEIERFQKERANVLIPSTQIIEGLSEFHKPVVDTVTLKVGADIGDVYEHQQKGKYIIAGQGLQKLAVCAGVVWNPRETRATCSERDYVSYNAVGCIRKADGSQVCFQAEYDIDMFVVSEEIREQYESKRSAWQQKPWFSKMQPDAQDAYIEGKIKKDVLFKRKHKMKLSATGAKNRVIRALLGIKKIYTTAEIQRPFVMLRIVLQPDYKDPEIKKMMLQASIQAITGVYGSQPAIDNGSQAIDISPEDFNTVPPDEPEITDPTTEREPGADEMSEKEALEADFMGADPVSQVKMLQKTAKAKNYDTATLKKPIGKFTDQQRISFWDKLNSMPDDEGNPFE